MALEHMTAVLEHSTRRGSRLILLLIVAFYSDQWGEWTVDQATLRKRARRLGLRDVKQILAELVVHGDLVLVSHQGRGRLSRYRLRIGAEAAKTDPAHRLLSWAQTAVSRVNRLLQEAGVPLPTPAQIVLWSKTLGGVDPLIDLLTSLIESGLATKANPSAYVHKVVMKPAAPPQAARALPPVFFGGVDDIRRQQAARLAGKRSAG